MAVVLIMRRRVDSLQTVSARVMCRAALTTAETSPVLEASWYGEVVGCRNGRQGARVRD